MLLPKIQRNSMLKPMCCQLACMNIELNAPSYHGSGWIGIDAGTWHGPCTAHG
jgi:hypothetical protein